MGEQVSRAALIEEISGMGLQHRFTIRDLAEKLGAESYRVRGAFAWCLAARIAKPSGFCHRRDRSGKKYRIVEYEWTGRTRATRGTPPPSSARVEAWLRGGAV